MADSISLNLWRTLLTISGSTILQNLFAQSLHENAYDHNWGLNGLSLKAANSRPIKNLRNNLDARQNFMAIGWCLDPARLLEEAKA